MQHSIRTFLFLALLSLLVMAAADNLSAEQFSRSGSNEVKTIVFFGDSLTAGYGLDPSQAFPALIQEKISARGWNFRAVNAGLSGETTAGGLRRIDWVLQRPIDVFVLELGANDGLRGLPVEDARKNLQVIIERVRNKYPHVKLLLAGMRVPSNLGRDYTTRFREMFPELASANQAALIPFLLAGVAGVPNLNLPDGIHPTPAGHKIVAANVWSVLEPVLQSLQP
jgi:acyl-CoA thioesterase-1